MADFSRNLYKAGESRKAYRTLYEFVAAYKVDQQSRIVLISYLLQDERIAEAGDVLVTTQVAHSPELRQLKARWYVAQGEHRLALHTLRENLPELHRFPDYYALLAAYYQRFGYSEKAAETYASLLDYDNESANWWAGFAIALDSSKQYQDAVNAYKHALQIPELRQELIEYIENRLSLLTVAASR
jgi:tetratricopeptide (TPR) repeat protein